MRRTDARAITRARTEEERRRRHIHGDAGATFSKGKYMVLSGTISGCITTLASKDNLCAEIYENQ